MEDYKFEIGDRITLKSKDSESYVPDLEGDIGTPVYGQVYIVSDREFAHGTRWYSLKGGSYEDDANFDLEKYFEKVKLTLKQLLED